MFMFYIAMEAWWEMAMPWTRGGWLGRYIGVRPIKVIHVYSLGCWIQLSWVWCSPSRWRFNIHSVLILWDYSWAKNSKSMIFKCSCENRIHPGYRKILYKPKGVKNSFKPYLNCAFSRVYDKSSKWGWIPGQRTDGHAHRSRTDIFEKLLFDSGNSQDNEKSKTSARKSRSLLRILWLVRSVKE